MQSEGCKTSLPPDSKEEVRYARLEFDRDLPGIKMEQLAPAQKAAIHLSQKTRAQGKKVRYIRTAFLPGEAHCICFFEAANPDVVKELNETAKI